MTSRHCNRSSPELITILTGSVMAHVGHSAPSICEDCSARRTADIPVAQLFAPDDNPLVRMHLRGDVAVGGCQALSTAAAQDRKLYASSSINLIKDLRDYAWKVAKKTGKRLNAPNRDWEHGLDAVR